VPPQKPITQGNEKKSGVEETKNQNQKIFQQLYNRISSTVI
jgi:hypothetical protein